MPALGAVRFTWPRKHRIATPLACSNSSRSLPCTCDPDAPRRNGFTHWVLYDLPPASIAFAKMFQKKLNLPTRGAPRPQRLRRNRLHRPWSPASMLCGRNSIYRPLMAKSSSKLNSWQRTKNQRKVSLPSDGVCQNEVHHHADRPKGSPTQQGQAPQISEKRLQANRT